MSDSKDDSDVTQSSSDDDSDITDASKVSSLSTDVDMQKQRLMQVTEEGFVVCCVDTLQRYGDCVLTSDDDKWARYVKRRVQQYAEAVRAEAAEAAKKVEEAAEAAEAAAAAAAAAAGMPPPASAKKKKLKAGAKQQDEDTVEDEDEDDEITRT